MPPLCPGKKGASKTFFIIIIQVLPLATVTGVHPFENLFPMIVWRLTGTGSESADALKYVNYKMQQTQRI